MQTSTQVDYKILSRTMASFLEENVAEWTADGYRLFGGLGVSKATKNSCGKLV